MTASSTLPRLRQLEERQVETTVELVQWSPKMDIVAIAMKMGDLQLFRLNWQKIWSAPPPCETALVSSLVWRPDGAVLAVGYTSGHLCLFEIEKNEPIHFNQSENKSRVTFLAWNGCVGRRSDDGGDGDGRREEQLKSLLNKKNVWHFITKFPPLSKAYSSNLSAIDVTEEVQKLHKEGVTPVSLLIAGHEDGSIRLFMNGFLLCAEMDLRVLASASQCCIEDVQVASNLSTFSALSTGPNCTLGKTMKTLKLSVLNLPLISTCFRELQVLSSMFSALHATLDYLGDTLKQISEAWEGIVVELDRKLAAYAKNLPRGSMAADFLDLLMMGTASPELETFLMQELTEKGLKKLETSTDNSYLNVQRLVLKYLHVVSQSINFILFEMQGLSEASEKYGVLGVKTSTIVAAQKRAALFSCKGYELQEVVYQSRMSFKSFFKWLQGAMVKMDDSLMEEQIKVSQQEIKFIAEFLESFDIDAEEAVTSGPKLSPSSPSAEAGAGANAEAFTHKHLEKVGQYLSSADLDTPANRKKSVWHQFLKDNPQIAKLDGIIVPNEKSSLMSEYKSLRQSVDAVFSDMKTDMTDRCQYLGEIVLPFEGTAGDLICRQFSTADQAAANAPIGADPSERRNMETHEIMGVITQPTKVFDHGQTDGLGTRVFYYELHPPEPARPQHPIFKAVWLSTDQDPQLQMKVVDIDFYTSDTLTLLLGNIPVNDHQRLLQFPLNACETSLRELPLNAFHPIKLSAQATYTLQTKNIFALSDLSCHRELENMAACKAAVSGPRKVSALLFRNRRRIRIYDMEVEDDEEEDDTLGTSAVSNELNSST